MGILIGGINKKDAKIENFHIFFCAPAGIRTPNLLIRSQMLYPIEPQVQL
jgi:hypothetical protein